MSEEAKNKIRSLKRVWDTDVDDKIGEKFTSPCIESSTLYRRLTGDFSSHVLRALKTNAIKNLLDSKENQCRIKILTHPSLTEEDKRTLENVLQHKQDLNDFLDKLMERSVENFLYKNEPHLNRQTRLDIFAQLIAKKNIIIKFAFSNNPQAIFHKKKGIFTFPWGDQLYHVGGNNETLRGLETSNEAFDTFQSWHDRDLEVIKINEKLFEDAWEGRSTKYITRKLNQNTLDKIIARSPTKFKNELKIKIIRKNQEPDPEVIKYDEKKDTYLTVTPKWDFQKKAREIFMSKKKGILKMATGTGKTRIALGIISELLNKKLINKIIIQMFGKALQNQWYDEIDNEWIISRLENEKIRILRSYERYNELDQFINNFSNKENIDLIVVSKKKLPGLLKEIETLDKEKCIIIHDEVHDLCTQDNIGKIKGMQKNIEYRLGLSATPKVDERNKFDFIRNQNLINEVGEIIFEFSLAQAIERGVLVGLDFKDLYYKLNREEKAKKARLAGALQNDELSDDEKDMIKIKMARINKLALNKIDVLEDFLKTDKDLLKKCFMFTLTKEYGDRVLNKVIPYETDVKTYYDEYADIINLEKFANGELECIISCRSLSQGVNLKRLENEFFFSIDGGRELIQRLGRVLRTDKENNPNKKATVVDFFDMEQMDQQKGADFQRFQELDRLSKIKFNTKYVN